METYQLLGDLGYRIHRQHKETQGIPGEFADLPWYISDTEVLPSWLIGSPNIVGNGGFCIRSRKFLDFSKSFVGYDGTRNEDVFI
jgi:hypothetical protein